jgi:hypothetical protein
MPVVIDQLDLVDTEPDQPRPPTEPAHRPVAADVQRTIAALDVVAARAARVHAD